MNTWNDGTELYNVEARLRKADKRIIELERENEVLRRAVIEFKCPTCGGSREIIYTGHRDHVRKPCPTCTPLMTALEGLTK